MTPEENSPKRRTLTDLSIIWMAWPVAQEFQAHGCTAVCLTPGWLRSEMMLDHFGVSEVNWQDATAKEPHFIISETPVLCWTCSCSSCWRSRGRLVEWSAAFQWSLAKVYGFTDLDGSQPDAWRYIQEVTEMGKPADATDTDNCEPTK